MGNACKVVWNQSSAHLGRRGGVRLCQALNNVRGTWLYSMAPDIHVQLCKYLAGCRGVRLRQALHRVRVHVQAQGEREAVLDLPPVHRLVVELEALEVHHQRVRQHLDAVALDGVDLRGGSEASAPRACAAVGRALA